MEQVVVITVFAVCAAICVNILSHSFYVAANAVDTRHAMLIAENTAESHKAFRGDLQRIAEAINGDEYGVFTESELVVFFDDDWMVSSEENAQFALRVLQHSDESLVFADIIISRLANNNEMISFTSAARRR